MLRPFVALALCAILIVSVPLSSPSASAMPDSNNSFGEAVTVENGMIILTTLATADDLADYYRIPLDAGDHMYVELSVPNGANFDLAIFDPSYVQMNSTSLNNSATGRYVEFMNYTAASTGWFYIRANTTFGSGSYFIAFVAQASWTIMVYLDGDNDLESYAIGDFLEMSAAGSNAELNIVALFDRAPGYASSYGDWTDTRRYWVTAGSQPNTMYGTSVGEKDMGDPNTLIDFVDYSIRTYPADHYALVLWDHGAQWEGICYDETDYSILDLPALRTAFLGIQAVHPGFVFDFVALDACNMASIEVEYQLNGFADVMVAAENAVPDTGLNYDLTLTALGNNPTMSAEQLAQQSIDDYMTSYRTPLAGYFNADVAMSSIDVANSTSVKNAASALSSALSSGMQKYVNYIETSRLASETYDGTNFTDLYDFAEEVALNVPNATIEQLARNLMDAINHTILYKVNWTMHNGGSTADANGLSVYFPYYQADYFVVYGVQPNLLFTTQTTWDEFLQSFYNRRAMGNSAPVINSHLPASNPFTASEGATQTYSVSASDSNGNALTYQWYLGGIITNGTLSSFDFTPNWTSSGTSVVLRVEVTDGAVMTSYSWTIDITGTDNLAPTSNVNAIASPLTNASSLGVTASASDIESQVSNVTLFFRYSTDNSSWGSWLEFGIDSAFPWSWGFNFPNGDGHYQFYSIANDTSNNAESPPGIADAYVQRDTTPPIAEAGSGVTTLGGIPTIFDGTGSYDVSGIVNYTWTFNDGATPVSLYGSNPSYTFNAIGNYTVTLTVRDNAGNTASDTIYVNITAVVDEFGSLSPSIIVLSVMSLLLLACIAMRSGRKKA